MQLKETSAITPFFTLLYTQPKTGYSMGEGREVGMKRKKEVFLDEPKLGCVA